MNLTGQLDELIAPLLQHEQVVQFTASRNRLAADPYRPTFHFSPPENFMNDPNGLCQWNGLYHLFYQFRQDGEDRVHWGHAVSADLLHWRDLPIAFYPDQEHDCFSGQTLAEDDRVIAIYHGTQAGNAIATASDPLLVEWEKHPDNPVIPIVPIDENGYPYRVFDPCIWKEADGYYSLSGVFKDGTRSTDCEGIDHIFRSTDLKTWEHLGPLVESVYDTEPGEDYAVPNFWPIGNGKHMLLFFSHKRGGQYFVGEYDSVTHRFTPERHGRMNYGPLAVGSLHAPSATIDDSGRFLSIFNVKESKEPNGWNDIMTLPRVLSLDEDGAVRIDPVKELESLRHSHQHFDEMDIEANSEIVLDGISGNAMEIEVELDPGDAHESGLRVLRSPDGAEQTRVSFFPKGHPRFGTAQLQIDGTASSSRTDIIPRTPEIGPLEIAEGEPLRLRIFIDRSIVEVFANGRQCLTLRAYPGHADSVGVSVFARGGKATVRSLDAWQMRSTWPELD